MLIRLYVLLLLLTVASPLWADRDPHGPDAKDVPELNWTTGGGLVLALASGLLLLERRK